jgi:hypothetical protein
MKHAFLPGLTAVVLSLFAVPSFAQQSKAVMIRLSPLPERVATADAVAVGKVTAIEDKTVSAEPFAGAKDKVEYQIAVIKVEDGLLGTKGLTHLKVGMVKVPEGKPVIRPGGRGAVRLAIDQEGLFFLHKHPTESFYLLQGPNDVINKASGDNFEKQVARAKECAKLLADPKVGLKSKDVGERALTAGLLVIRYTTPAPGQTKLEPIPAEESKQVLTALADGDWTRPNSQDDLTPQWAFSRLRLTDKDGWNPGPLTGPNAFPDAAKGWLKAHADSYRIQRFVGEKKEK